jgi:hypothetical protein
MTKINWQAEQARLTAIVYPATLKAAKRAFWTWPEHKRDDAIQECLTKMWDQWSRLVQNGKTPQEMVGSLIKYAILWVRYDRRIAGRTRTPDIYDHRAGFKQQQISDQGVANPSDRSDATNNASIDWNLHSGDSPLELASALEQTGVTLSQWCDL